MNSELKLAVEMKKLSDTMQGLKEAIKRQENQLKNYKEYGFQEIQLIPNRGFSEERQISEDYIACGNGAPLRESQSEMSQNSHWSCSLDMIHSSITELKGSLQSQDKHAIRLMAENKELRNVVKKKEKELKKQRILLKAERESFEQYKREFCSDLKKQKSENFEEAVEEKDRSHKEVKKLHSELAHYKQLYLEQSHTVNRFTREVNSLKSDNIQLKGKLLQQDTRFNRLILEMAQRFKKSKDEMDLYASKEFESLSPQKINVALYRTAARNARLAYDNSMLKREVEILKQQIAEKLSEKKSMGTRLKCPSSHENYQYSSNLSDIISRERLSNVKNSASGVIEFTNHQKKSLIKTSLSGSLERNRDRTLPWHQVSKRKSSSKMITESWDCQTEDSTEYLVRTYSAPELNNPKHPFCM